MDNSAFMRVIETFFRSIRYNEMNSARLLELYLGRFMETPLIVLGHPSVPRHF